MTERSAVPLGPLAPFHAAGVLGLADVHVAAALFRIAGEPLDAEVALAAALCVRALRHGSVCLDLTEDPADWELDDDPDVRTASPEPGDLPWPTPERWLAAAAGHPMVSVGPDAPGDRPLRLVGGLIYLERSWSDEQVVREQVAARSRLLPANPDRLATALRRLFPELAPDRQRLAASTAALRGLTIMAGGPGTGKTTTVARLLAVLRDVHGERLTVALAAPTGKAAARLQQAVSDEVATLASTDRAALGGLPATTVHRLLGWRSDGRFGHDRSHPLPHDVVVVDECSMVSLTLMARLLEAVRADARVVLVGDPDQLASVDAGAVLGDLVAARSTWREPGQDAEFRHALAIACPFDVGSVGPSPGVVVLDRSHRFGGSIAALAAAVRAGDADTALGLLAAGHPELELVDPSDAAAMARALAAVRAEVLAQATTIRAAAEAGDALAALAGLDAVRVLCAHRHGPHGVTRWNGLVEAWIGGSIRAAAGPSDDPWWAGRPVLVTANDYAADVYNGDSGVVVATGAGVRVAFARGAVPLLVAPARLQHVESLRALTIHRGQGSQFGAVTVVLPPPGSPLLTRELVYTAITRARHRVRLIGTPDALSEALARPVRRASGLRRDPSSLEVGAP